MITEDYVSFETAKLLKEKGFDEGCSFVVNTISKGVMPVSWPTTNSDIEDEEACLIALPTIQMAMKWLRTNFNVNPVPYAMSLGWAFDIFDLSDRDITGSKKLFSMDFPKKSDCFNSYEEAAESAIRYYLENLI